MRLAQWLRRVTGRHQWHPLEVRRDSRTELSLEYLTFKDLTTSNDELLEIITDIERKLTGDLPFGMTYIRARVVAAATHAYRMIACLDQLSVRRTRNSTWSSGRCRSRSRRRSSVRGRPSPIRRGWCTPL